MEVFQPLSLAFVSTTTKAQHGTTREKAKPTNLCSWDVLWETKGVLEEKYLRKSLCQNLSQVHSPPRTLYLILDSPVINELEMPKIYRFAAHLPQ